MLQKKFSQKNFQSQKKFGYKKMLVIQKFQSKKVKSQKNFNHKKF